MDIIGTNVMIDFTQEEMNRIQEYSKRNNKLGYFWMKDLIMQEVSKDELKKASNICPVCGEMVYFATPRITEEDGTQTHLDCWYKKKDK